VYYKHKNNYNSFMSIREKICPHKSDRQLKTTHGLFCLDCGHLETKALKNNGIVQKHLRLSGSDSEPTASPSTLITHHGSRLDMPTSSGAHVKISMADITPKKRAK
jgi:hypothetical protein